MRTIIELPEEQLQDLAVWCRRESISRAEAIRRAITGYLQAARSSGPANAFGLWRDRGLDSLAYERALRSEWDARPGLPRRAPKAR